MIRRIQGASSATDTNNAGLTNIGMFSTDTPKQSTVVSLNTSPSSRKALETIKIVKNKDNDFEPSFTF